MASLQFIRHHTIRSISSRLFSTQKKPLIVLGIETSCDDTSAAIVTSDRRILAEVVRGQLDVHEPMGGIVPTLASKHHSRNLPSVICETLERANLSVDALDAIAVTRGPGLPPCLPVGLNAAKTLAAVHRKPLIGVHHMEAHALTARLTSTTVYPEFPFMTLLISGGHTLLMTANQLGHYETLATTLDDAVGEAIDKTARQLNLAWVKGRRGGPGAALEKAALRGDPDRFPLPVPMLQRNKSVWGFSFSGLKSKVAQLVQQMDLSDEQTVCDMAAAFQMTCVRHLEQKIGLALEREVVERKKPLTALVVSGGVASNALFRSRLERLAGLYGLPLICPPAELCTDNGVMIAWTGLERLQAGLVDDYSITTLPKWPLDTLIRNDD